MVFENLLTLPIEELATQFFIPFILIFAILWGLLGSMRIFARKINIVLAIGITVLISATPYFAIFANLVAQYTGFVAVGVFGIVLIFGIIRWGFSRGRDIYYETGGSHKKVEKIEKEIAKLREKMRDEGNPAKRRAYAKTIGHLKEEAEVAYSED